MNRLRNQKVIFIFLVIFMAIPTAHAEPDIFAKLLKSIGFAETNKAQLEFDCRENLVFKSNLRLKELCGKRNRIPDYVIEEAALPYLRKYVSERIAKQAIESMQTEVQRALSNKVRQEIASGKRDRLTAEDLRLLEKRNESEYGRALFSFSSDKEQAAAVGRAMLNYEL